MKLFLSALGVSPALQPAFFALVGKDAGDIRLAHVENAADPLPEARRGFLAARREELSRLCGDYRRLDLREYLGRAEALQSHLTGVDVVWLGGGNVFSLRWLLRASGFEQIAHALLERGVVIGGGSAGAIVLGPTLEGFEAVDDPSLAPEHLLSGLGLVKFAPIPHWGNAGLAAALGGIRARLQRRGIETAPIRDGQAVVVNGTTWEVVPPQGAAP